MATQSIFRQFIASLRRHWKAELPYIRPLETSLGPMLPKASAFYAGFSQKVGFHVFIRFQHSVKAWEVGSFTANIILAATMAAPSSFGPFSAPDDGRSFEEGSFRLSTLLRRPDKWWQLKQDASAPGADPWKASTYADTDAVISEAVADVTKDVCAGLEKLGIVV